jgi:hypothetical protein
LSWPSKTAAYAVLAHEAIIDSVWDTNIRPLLLKRFPGATGAEIKEAHGYDLGRTGIKSLRLSAPHRNVKTAKGEVSAAQVGHIRTPERTWTAWRDKH